MPKWTKPAQKDLHTQLTYIQKENPGVVRTIALHIKTTTQSLDSFPRLGKDGQVKGTRELVIPRLPFVCVYRVKEGQVEILRLLHQRIQWPSEE